MGKKGKNLMSERIALKNGRLADVNGEIELPVDWGASKWHSSLVYLLVTESLYSVNTVLIVDYYSVLCSNFWPQSLPKSHPGELVQHLHFIHTEAVRVLEAHNKISSKKRIKVANEELTYPFQMSKRF